MTNDRPSPIHPDRADPSAGWSAMQTLVAHECDTLAAFGAMLGATPGNVDPARAYHAWIKSGQEPIAVVAGAVDAYTATHHTLKRGRNKRGATAEVTSFGRVPTLVGVDPFRDAGSATRDDVVSLDARTLVAMADAYVRLVDPDGEPLPPLVGSVQGRSWESIVDASADPSSSVLLAKHRCGLSAGASPALDAIARAKGDVPPPRAVARHRTRLSIRRPAVRGSDPDAICAAWAVDTAGTASLVPLKRAIRRWAPEGRRAGSVDAHGRFVTYGDTGGMDGPSVRKVRRIVHRWNGTTDVETDVRRRARRAAPSRVAIGHAWQDRPGVKLRRSGVSTRDAARAVRASQARAAVAACASTADGAALVSGWYEAEHGEPTCVTLPSGGMVTFTRRASATMRYRYSHGAQSATFTARTPEAAAVRLATLTR